MASRTIGLTVAQIVVTDVRPDMPAALGALATMADSEGIRNVSFVVERWNDGGQRFDGPSEALLAAVVDGEVVAVGGLTSCPHVEGALRVRRFYVAPAWRRRGVATALARELIESARGSTQVVTCNAQASEAAGPFWESLGFVPSPIDGITHDLDLEAAP